jgi:hypothetical protein
MWKAASQIEKLLQGWTGTERLADLWALHYFCQYAVFSNAYETGDIWATLVVPSESGEQIIEVVSSGSSQFSRADLALAMFRLFFFDDLLIDWEKSDPNLIMTQLDLEMSRGCLRWPYLFGRLLYDRFNDTATSDRTEHLHPDEVEALLEGTPAGVYQVGSVLSGPFGFLRSAESRFLLPTTELPLWHCSDTGCGALHRVSLLPPPVPVEKASVWLAEVGGRIFGQRSEWRVPLDHLLRPGGRYRGRKFYDLAVLVANGIVGPERSSLLAAALRSDDSTALRSVLSRAIGRVGKAPDAVAAALTEEQQLQLLLLLPDRNLQELIDRCVYDDRIRIPVHEIRTPRINAPKMSNRDRSCELSSFGLRAKPRLPLAALHTAIWEAYERAGLLDELGWRLRRQPGAPPANALMEFIRTRQPEQVIADLILSSMPVTQALSTELAVDIARVGSEGRLAALFLWRLGFDPAQYSDDYPRFRTRLEDFNSTVLASGEVRTEDDRERVRAIGVNLFVSVEHFLTELVAYNTWLLASDHFLGKFTYSHRVALEKVRQVLGTSIESGSVSVSWSASGQNALGTLLVYAQRMVTWMEGLKSRDRKAVCRPASDLPHFADDEREQTFVFWHTALWADADPRELETYVDAIAGIVSQVSRADAASIRNGLDHQRGADDFPEAASMLACVARLRDALEMADTRRYLPKSYWLMSVQSDRFGRDTFIYRDYRQREITLGGPAIVLGLPRVNFRKPVLIAPGNLLGKPNSELRFSIQEDSIYAEYWRNYPRRRRIPAPVQATPDEGALT